MRKFSGRAKNARVSRSSCSSSAAAVKGSRGSTGHDSAEQLSAKWMRGSALARIGADHVVLEAAQRHRLPADRQLAQHEEADLVEAGMRGGYAAFDHVEHRQRVVGVDH